MTGRTDQREGTYGMLAELFSRPPEEEEIATILGVDKGFDSDELAADFTELLRGLRSSSPSPPYESLHLEGVMMGEATDRVLETYRAFGVHRAIDMTGEPADHIAFELDFMRHLCSLEASSDDPEERRRLRMAQEGFLSDHLARWVDLVREGITASDRTGFYARVAEFTSEWVSSDLAHLRMDLGTGGVAP